MSESVMTPEMVVEKIQNAISEKTKGFATSDEIVSLKNDLELIREKANADQTIELKTKFVELESQINALKEIKKDQPEAKKTLFSMIKEKAENIKNIIVQKSGVVSLIVKANQIPADIDGRELYAQDLGGTVRRPVRATRIIDLFRRVRVSTEFVKYREEDVVTRDGKVVVACATSTHNTKKTWKVRTVQIAKIRDFVDVCIDMMDDFSFVTSEVEQLVNESVKLIEDREILLGAGDILSIDAISSIFDPANVLAPYTGAFTFPTIAELTGAMKAQIYTFGAENSWNADTILMNYNDFVKFQHQKNQEGDYLLPNFVSTGSAVLNGMNVVTSPLVAPNELYVFDSTRGVILEREGVEVSMSYENNDNFEHEVVTVKAVERIQFHVPTVERDAFMKCDDIATALTDITAP
jgi:HK97 family phage major capsid protein